MKQVCKYDVKRDRGTVLLGLAPDINQMLKDHTIPKTSASVVYNKLEEVKSVGFKVNDDFDAIMLSRALKAGLTPKAGTGNSQGVTPVASGNDATSSD